MDLISIIVPVYNVEKYIHRCVDSIINQTYKNIEIILVDDGSPDNCGKICDEYAQKDNRVKVIHKENGGLSDARNCGIDVATGDWLVFVDSDDWLHNHTVEKLHNAVNKYGVSVSVCNYEETSEESPYVDTNCLPELWTPKELYLNRHIEATVAWGKLYHKKCFDEIRYPVGKIHEDEFVTYRIIFAQEKIAFIDQPYYSYYVNPNGITKGVWTPKRLDALNALFSQLSFFEKSNDIDLITFELNYLYWFLSEQKEAICVKEYPKENRFVKRCLIRLIFGNHQHFFNPSNAYMAETQYPVFMKYYWLFRAVVKKILRRK